MRKRHTVGGKGAVKWTQMKDGWVGGRKPWLQQMWYCDTVLLCSGKGWKGHRCTERGETAGLARRRENNISPHFPLGDFPRESGRVVAGKGFACGWKCVSGSLQLLVSLSEVRKDRTISSCKKSYRLAVQKTCRHGKMFTSLVGSGRPS